MSQNAAPKQSNMSFLTGANAEYISHLYGEFLSNPARVDESWQGFFEALNDNEIELLQELNGASWTPDENRKSTRRFDHIGEGAGIVEAAPAVKPAANKSVSSEDLRSQAKDSIRALKLIRAYRARGHLLSDLDPLELKEKNHHPELDPAHYGFTGPTITTATFSSMANSAWKRPRSMLSSRRSSRPTAARSALSFCI
jgi:2-oxoglutarate dehydrogenase E1 component